MSLIQCVKFDSQTQKLEAPNHQHLPTFVDPWQNFMGIQPSPPLRWAFDVHELFGGNPRQQPVVVAKTLYTELLILKLVRMISEGLPCLMLQPRWNYGSVLLARSPSLLLRLEFFDLFWLVVEPIYPSEKKKSGGMIIPYMWKNCGFLQQRYPVSSSIIMGSSIFFFQPFKGIPQGGNPQIKVMFQTTAGSLTLLHPRGPPLAGWSSISFSTHIKLI